MTHLVSLIAEGSRREELLIHSTTGHAIYMLDPIGLICSWNQGAQYTQGFAAEEIIGRRFSLFYTAEDRGKGEPERNLRLAAELGHYEAEGWRVRKNGNRFWASVTIDPVYEDGELIGFAKVTRDISRQHEAEEKLVQTNHILEIALSNMLLGFVLYDSAGKLILANHRLAEIFSVPFEVFRPGMNIVETMRAMGLSVSQVKQIDRELRAQSASGSPLRLLQETQNEHIVLMVNRCLPDVGWVSTFEDVTMIRQAELMLGDLACLDPLTGLAHRVFFRSRLREAVAQMRRGIPFALLLLDIKDFNSINDVLGESAGDELLKATAQRIRDQVREVDSIARLDGSKFAILQCNPEVPKDTEMLASRLMDRLSIPYKIEGQSVIAPPNMGIALGMSDGSEADEFLKNAGLALNRAQQSLLPCFSFFNAQIDSQLRAQRALEEDLYEASRRGEFTLYYQQIADTQSGQIAGFEALLRWRHPARGWVSPAEFVPVAEECGLIVSIGEWVLRTACAQAASWSSPFRIAVNLSPVQFQDERLPATVAQVLEMAGLDAHRLELEVTESLLLEDNDLNLGILSRLREMGVRISLDDFGTGYSSLSYLRSFPFDKLKIDRSFIQDLSDNDSSQAIVDAVIGLGKSFGISVVAEGVETEQQLEYLQQHGCDQVQGYLWGKPQPADTLWGTASTENDRRNAQP